MKGTVTVKFEDGTEFTEEFDGMTGSTDRGFVVTYGALTAEPLNIEPNGHFRGIIRWWRGCKDWDSFKDREEHCVINKRT